MFRKIFMLYLMFGLVMFIGFESFSYAGPDFDGGNTGLVDGNSVTAIDDSGAYKPFLKVGEVLEYDLWVKTLIHGGKQTVKVLALEPYQDRDAFRVQCAMKTIGLAWSLTKYSEVEDVVLDRDGLFPLAIRREIHQGKTTIIDKVIFDYSQGIATRTYSVDNGESQITEIKLPGIVHDAVSLQFFLRKCDFQKGYNKLYYYENGVVEETSYNVSEGAEALKLACGVYDKYYKIEHGKGKITVLIAQEPKRIPLVIRVMASFGKVEAKLVKFQ